MPNLFLILLLGASIISIISIISFEVSRYRTSKKIESGEYLILLKRSHSHVDSIAMKAKELTKEIEEFYLRCLNSEVSASHAKDEAQLLVESVKVLEREEIRKG